MEPIVFYIFYINIFNLMFFLFYKLYNIINVLLNFLTISLMNNHDQNFHFMSGYSHEL
jgi:hypothetical protein